MERDYDPADGVGRFQAGTPPILALAAVEEGARLTAEAGIDALRAKSVALTELIVALHDAWLAPLGFSLGSPRDSARRGSHVSLRHPDAWPINVALIERAAVIPDFRGPDSIRLGVAPLYTGHADVWDALDRLRGLVERGEHRLVDTAPGTGHVATASGARPRAAPARVGPGISVAAAITSRNARQRSAIVSRALAQRVAEHHDAGRDRGRVARDRGDRDHRDALADLQRARRGEERADAGRERDERRTGRR